MSEEEKKLLAKIVEGLLLLDSRELPRLYCSGLLNAAHLADVTKYLDGWTPNQPASREGG